MKTHITSNGSKWAGEEPDPIDVLWPLIETEPLDGWLYPFVYKSKVEPPSWHILGNFQNLSHVFNITTDDPELGKRFETAISENCKRFGIKKPKSTANAR